jgi:UDP-hydrolysing UDP-N-acetyl-D-glucosamine 2-epimerase
VKIHYVSGSRADFGLMLRTLRELDAAPGHDLALVVTGQHTVAKYGSTEQEIADSGIRIAGVIPVALSGTGGGEMALALADELAGMTRLWQADRPDLVLLLGDRGEMLAAALAAVHLGIHVGHFHGGERSGTLDESFRHAISKLSHFHLTATDEARDRLVRMGEDPNLIWVTGAPGLVGLSDGVDRDRASVLADYGLSPETPRLALTVFHPVVQEAALAGTQVQAVVEATATCGYAQIVLRPNSDAGGAKIDSYLDGLREQDKLRVVTHLKRQSYTRLLANADLLVGNSSSGIIESASFGTPCVNVGSRQNGRQRNRNVIDCPDVDAAAIAAAIDRASELPRVVDNVYGDGNAHLRLLKALAELSLAPEVLLKQNRY